MSQLTRPTRPKLGDAEHYFNHYAVHLAANWICELTDLKVESVVQSFALHHRQGTKMNVGQLHVAASLLLREITANSDHFSSEVYASLYYHISRGLP
jgi:hypothetical protein